MRRPIRLSSPCAGGPIRVVRVGLERLDARDGTSMDTKIIGQRLAVATAISRAGGQQSARARPERAARAGAPVLAAGSRRVRRERWRLVRRQWRRRHRELEHRPRRRLLRQLHAAADRFRELGQQRESQHRHLTFGRKSQPAARPDEHAGRDEPRAHGVPSATDWRTPPAPAPRVSRATAPARRFGRRERRPAPQAWLYDRACRSAGPAVRADRNHPTRPAETNGDMRRVGGATGVLIALASAAVTACLVLAGCGGSSSKGASAPSTTAGARAVVSSTTRPTTTTTNR